MNTPLQLPTQTSRDFSIRGDSESPRWIGVDRLLVYNELDTNPSVSTIEVENTAYSYVTFDGTYQIQSVAIDDVRLVKNGSIVGGNLLSTEVELLSDNEAEFSVDIDETIATAKKEGFGVAVAFKYWLRDNYLEIDYYTYTEHVVLTDMVYSIPPIGNAKKFNLKITNFISNLFFPPTYPSVLRMFNIEVGLDYELDAGGLKLYGLGSTKGYLGVVGREHSTENVERKYQYMVYAKGEFLGEINDVTQDPSVRTALNSFPGDVTVDVARNADSDYYDTEPLEIVDDGDPEPLVTERLETIDATGDAVKSFGEGTIIDVNNNVDIYEYYGNYEGFVLDDGEPLIFDDLQEMETPIGSPEGRVYFSGYISKYDVTYGKRAKKTSRLTLLSHTDEYNNIVLEKTDEDFLTIDGGDDYYRGIGRDPGPEPQTDNKALAQTFLFPAAKKLSTVYLKVKRFGAGDMPPSNYPNVTMTIRKGNPADNGEVVASVEAAITNNTPYWQAFPLPADITLAASQRYSIIFTTDKFVSWSYADYPVQFFAGSGYGDGAAYYNLAKRGKSGWDTGTWYVSSGIDIQMRLATRGGDTLVPMFSQDPSQMFKNVVDFGASKGSLVKYLENSITPSGTVVSAKFNMQTLKEALDAIITYSPTDWYWYIDQSDLTLYLNRRSEEVSHVFTLGKDIEELKLEKSIEDLVNEVYFTGGNATAAIPLPYQNSAYSGAGAAGNRASSPIFLPEPGVEFKVYGDYPGKTAEVLIAYYHNGSTTATSNTGWTESGKLVFKHEPLLNPTLTGISIGLRASDDSTIAPNSAVLSMISDSNVYRHLVNQESQSKYRKALVKKTDQRVTNSASADIIAAAEMDRNPAPIHAATLTVVRNEYLKHVSPGQLVGFKGFGNFVDLLQLVVMEVELNRDIMTLSLGAFAPKTSKRLEDLKRNLQMLEAANNPSAPTSSGDL